MNNVLQPRLKGANKKGEPGISQRNLKLFRNQNKKKVETTDDAEVKEGHDHHHTHKDHLKPKIDGK